MLDVDLHRHRWATALPVLDRFSTAVEEAAAATLRPF